MNYEQKYKNALKWARLVKDGRIGFDITAVEKVFPELKESEDERIRRAILEGLIDCRDAPDLGWTNFGGIKIDDCIAWLEKQSEKVDCPQNLQVPNGGIVLEDFNGGEGHYKVNLDFLNKNQVEEIENIVNGWNKTEERR